MKGKEEDKKRRPYAGFTSMLLHFSKNAKVLIIIGAILIAIGFIGGSYFGSIVVTEISQGKINHVTSTPYPVNGIDPVLSEEILFSIGTLGIAILVLGIASRSRNNE